MRGFILAAGLGTRLRPLTERLPKPLVPVAGVPLVLRALLQMRDAGVDEIGINLFHLGHLIQEFLGDGRRYGVALTYFDEQPTVLGTGGGLKNAEGFLRDGGDRFVLANADVWHDFDLSAILQGHAARALATMVVHRCDHRPELHNVGCWRDDLRSGQVVHIAGKPRPEAVAEFLGIYTGVAVYSTRLLDWLPAAKVSGLVSHGLLPAMEQGEMVRFLEPDGHWFDCGTHAELLRASHFALKSRRHGLDRRLRSLGRATTPLRDVAGSGQGPHLPS